MRNALSLLMSLVLFCTLVIGGSVPQALPTPAYRVRAWWGLLYPGLFSLPAGDGEGVTFTWPLLEYLVGLFRSNA